MNELVQFRVNHPFSFWFMVAFGFKSGVGILLLVFGFTDWFDKEK
jgi:hypothetical protein